MAMNCAAVRSMTCVSRTIVLALAGMALTCAAGAQTESFSSNEAKPAEARSSADAYQVFYLTNTQQAGANEIQTDLRNMIPRAKVYYVQSQGALTLRGTPDDLGLAQKILADTDRPKNVYRLTYSLTETDGGKSVGTQHFSLVVVAGSRATLKQGSKVPIVTGMYDTASASQSNHAQNNQVQYLDVGLLIDAKMDGEHLTTKIEQSSVAEEKSGMGAEDPVVRQTSLEATSALTHDPQVPHRRSRTLSLA